MVLIHHDRADDPLRYFVVTTLQVGEQLLHGAACTGAGAEHQNLFGALQSLRYRFVKTFQLRFSLAVGELLSNVVDEA